MAYARDEDGLEGSPWYVRALVRVGAPTAFSALLLWYLMTNVTGAQSAILMSLAELMKVNVTVAQNQDRIIDLLLENAEAQRQNRAVLLAMCYNQTMNETEVQRCNEAFR